MGRAAADLRCMFYGGGGGGGGIDGIVVACPHRLVNDDKSRGTCVWVGCVLHARERANDDELRGGGL